jgi:putative heme iron utilization protein
MTNHTPNPDDPVSREAGGAIAHLNADHADALLDMARALGGCPEATSARCLDADTVALTLEAKTPSDTLTLRIPYGEPIADAAGLRKATVKLAHRARAALDTRQ